MIYFSVSLWEVLICATEESTLGSEYEDHHNSVGHRQPDHRAMAVEWGKGKCHLNLTLSPLGNFDRQAYDSFTVTALPLVPKHSACPHLGPLASISQRWTFQAACWCFFKLALHLMCDSGRLAPFLIPVCVCGDLQEKADLGELNFSLCYLPTAGRLTATIIKANNLKAMDLTGFSGKGNTHQASAASSKLWLESHLEEKCDKKQLWDWPTVAAAAAAARCFSSYLDM